MEMFSFRKVKKILIALLLALTCVTAAIATVCFSGNAGESAGVEVVAAADSNDANYAAASDDAVKSDVYLSDRSAANGFPGSGALDKTSGGGKLTLKIDGAATYFDKGLYTPTPSYGIIYNISGLDYKYFFSYIGVQSGTSANGRAVFKVAFSNSASGGWVYKFTSEELSSADDAKELRVETDNYSYMRIEAAFAEGTRISAAAVWADAKFTDSETNEVQYLVKSVAEYDKLIKTEFKDADLSDPEFELALLQRNYVSKFGENGHITLHNYIKLSPQNEEAFFWLFDNVDVLRMYTTGGDPDNGNMYAGSGYNNYTNYFNSLKVLTSLYTTYKSDLADDSLSPLGTKRSTVYQKMLISISLTYSRRIRFWIYDIGPSGNDLNRSDNDSNAIARYAAFKKCWLEEKLDCRVFENIDVEEMRYVMNTLLPDNEIEWLLDYCNAKGSRGPYSYMTYRIAYEFWAGVPHLYDPAKKDYYYNKYNLDGYGIEYKKYYVHAWMMFETGGVCWNLSNMGANMISVWGHPCIPMGQSGYVEHVAYADYYINSDGDGYWGLANNVFGWQNTNFSNFNNLGNAGGWYTQRAMNDWGVGSYASSHSGTYLFLSQAALNDFENYERAKELTLLAEIYGDDLAKQEDIYRQALKVQSINLDAWLGLINNYAKQGKTAEEFLNLAREAGDALKYYPLPMHDMLSLIGKYASNPEHKAVLSMIENANLKLASTATEAQVLQSSITRFMANYLLGIVDTEVATFEFDGDGGATLSLGKMYANTSQEWEYCIDGGAGNWIQTGGKSVSLTPEQIAAIDVDKDVWVHVIGTDRTPENIYVIDITKANAPSGFYANDWENKVYGLDDTMDWRYAGDTVWTAFMRRQPDLKGDKNIEIRRRATGTVIESDAVSYSFTSAGEDNPLKRYIPVSELSVYQVSSEATSHQGQAANIIDGNYNTRWHSDWNGRDTQRFIIIEFARQYVLSGMDYIPAGGGNGKILKGKIYGSATGDYWTELATVNWANNEVMKSVDFADNNLKIKYLKIVGEQCSGRGSFITGRMFNFYHNEEASATPNPVATVEFDSTVITNGNITATIVNPSTSIVVTNNGGRTAYTFTESGSFTFEFKDANGLTGSVTAVVDWIDKTPPTATATYSTTNKTNQNVTVTLSFSEEGVVVNNNNGRNTYVFSANGQYTFYFTDKAGNQNTFTAEVNNIFKDSPKIVNIEYSTLEPTNGNVDVTFYFDRPVIMTGFTTQYAMSQTRTFTANASNTPCGFKDEVGNTASTGITINNIDKTAPVGTITYSTTSKADKVVAYITFNEENVTITNNGGASYVTFTQNGGATFTFVDRAGNTGSARATVNWIDANFAAPEITYSTTELTNKDVTATLNVGGETLTHNFTENGSYTFNYTFNGEERTATAVIDWIDKTAPTATVTYSTPHWSRNSISVFIYFDEDNVEILNNGGSNEYVFDGNGLFVFEYRDKAGNKGTKKVLQTSIFKKPPVPSFTYSTKNPTNKNVKVTLSGWTVDDTVDESSREDTDFVKAYNSAVNRYISQSIKVTSNGGNNYFIFEQNGSFTFSYYDGASNVGSTVITVDWIDKTAPVGTIVYSNYDVTRDAVTASIAFDKPDATVTNNDGSSNYTFTENGSFTFTFKDKLGNVGEATASVTWINQSLPVVSVSYDITEKTDKDVVATISFDTPDVVIINNDGNFSYTFTENGSFTFEYIYGGNSFASSTVEVTWIKKTISIKYFDVELLKEDVIAYGSGYQILYLPENTGEKAFSHWANGNDKYYEGAIVNLEDDLSLTAVFTENTDPDPGEPDNPDEPDTPDEPDNPDEPTTPSKPSKPVIEFDKTNKHKAVVKITLPEEGATFVDGNGTYEFTKNGKYVIDYYNKAGELCSVEVIVDWLEESNNPNKLPLIIGIVAAVAVVVSAGVVTVVIMKKRRV